MCYATYEYYNTQKTTGTIHLESTSLLNTIRKSRWNPKEMFKLLEGKTEIEHGKPEETNRKQ